VTCPECNRKSGNYKVASCAGCYERLTIESAKTFTSKEWRERYVKYCMVKRGDSFEGVKDEN
jgi:hypothetical protein